MYKRQEISALKEVILLIILMLGGILLYLLFTFLGLLPNLGSQGFSETINNAAAHIPQLKFIQITQSICLFIIPAFLYYKLTEYTDSITFFIPNKKPQIRSSIIIILSVLAAIPLINFFGYINAKMTFPSALSNIEHWMQNAEQRAAVFTELIVSGDQWSQLLLNLLMIAILPAIGEELIFRGILQKTLHKATNNKHIAIGLAAFVFSAFHLQFYGFLPRFFLGIALGYLYFSSGSLYLPMLAHFINNAFATITYYLFNNGYISENLDHIGTGENWISAVLSASILLIIFFYLERNKSQLQLNEFKQTP